MEDFMKREGAYSTFDSRRLLEVLYDNLKDAKRARHTQRAEHLATLDTPIDATSLTDMELVASICNLPENATFISEVQIPDWAKDVPAVWLNPVIYDYSDELKPLMDEVYTLDMGHACTAPFPATVYSPEMEAAYQMQEELGAQYPLFMETASKLLGEMDAPDSSEVVQILAQNLSQSKDPKISELLKAIALYRISVIRRMRRRSARRYARRIIRRIRNQISVLLKAIWRNRISTASRSNANATDKMLLTIPTPPTDDYDTIDYSCQWGGDVNVLPI